MISNRSAHKVVRSMWIFQCIVRPLLIESSETIIEGCLFVTVVLTLKFKFVREIFFVPGVHSNGVRAEGFGVNIEK
jgi:hypothetical protein